MASKIEVGQSIVLSPITQSCLFANVLFRHVSTRMLVDTGSAVNLISKTLCEDLGVDITQLTPISTSLAAANGSSLEQFGVVELEFSLEGMMFSSSYIVADLVDIPGILGMEFLEKNDVNIFTSKPSLKIGETEILLEKSSTLSKSVRLCKQVVVPANSELLVDCFLEGGRAAYSEGLIEPVSSLGNEGLLCARTLVDPRTSCIVVSIMNINDRNVTLKQGQAVATLEAVTKIHSITPQTKSKHNTTRTLPEHLKPLVEGASTTLSEQEKERLTKLLIDYDDIFLGPDNKLGRTKLVQHKIDTGNALPFKTPLRRHHIQQKPIIEEELKKMLEQDIIEPSESPWSSPVLLVTKKDGSVRFCIDFRQLNSITRKDAYPLPRIDESLDALGGSQFFSTLDLASGHWQCEVEEKDRPKTAFSTHKGLFQFKVMPFGLCNAPACFERLMDLVLRGLLWEKCLCYLDDIIIMGATFHQALDNLELVFQRFRQANLKLKPKKCVLLQTEVLFLGHKVTREGISTDPSKIKAVKSWPVPESVKEVKGFLGLAGYYRRFIPSFSEIAVPLTKLTRNQ